MQPPKVISKWDSRFKGTHTRTQYNEFREDYMCDVQREFSARLESRQNLIDRKTAAVDKNKKLAIKASQTFVSSGASTEQLPTLQKILSQLEKSKEDVKVAEDSLESLQMEKEEKESGRKDQENIDWLRTICLIDENNAREAATYATELHKRLDAIPDGQWNIYKGGSMRKLKRYATYMSQIATYYDSTFSETEFGILLGVRENHHNVKLAIEKLVHLRIMEKRTNQQGATTYGLVSTLRIHLRYDPDDSLQEDLDRSYREGHDIINKRSRKKQKVSDTLEESLDTDEEGSDSDDEQRGRAANDDNEDTD